MTKNILYVNISLYYIFNNKIMPEEMISWAKRPTMEELVESWKFVENIDWTYGPSEDRISYDPETLEEEQLFIKSKIASNL